MFKTLSICKPVTRINVGNGRFCNTWICHRFRHEYQVISVQKRSCFWSKKLVLSAQTRLEIDAEIVEVTPTNPQSALTLTLTFGSFGTFGLGWYFHGCLSLEVCEQMCYFVVWANWPFKVKCTNWPNGGIKGHKFKTLQSFKTRHVQLTRDLPHSHLYKSHREALMREDN